MAKKTTAFYKFIKWCVKVFSPKLKLKFTENYPNEPVIVVGNHTQMYGPIASELYFPREHLTWCAGEMMHLKQVPKYAFTDFWSQKPKWTHPFYRALAFIIAPLAAHIFNNANTIAVYHDSKVLSTFKASVKALCEGQDIVIFPEKDEKFNNILYNFQDKFIDVARLYYKKSGKAVCFLPVYIAPNLETVAFGKPTRYDVTARPDEERRRICDYLMTEITAVARQLPLHTVVPYRNVPKKYYPKNREE